MGRPREHDERTARALLAAAERAVQEHGPESLSVRGVASDVGTTTRAVYSLFGSKHGLIAALGAHAFDLLRDGLAAMPSTGDPQSDLIAAGLMFRRFAIEHPSLFAIGVQRTHPPSGSAEQISAAANSALDALKAIVGRLDEAQLLGGRTVNDATLEFHALCEGLAAIELRGVCSPPQAQTIWKQALSALVSGFAIPITAQPHPEAPGPASRRPTRALRP